MPSARSSPGRRRARGGWRCCPPRRSRPSGCPRSGGRSTVPLALGLGLALLVAGACGRAASPPTAPGCGAGVPRSRPTVRGGAGDRAGAPAARGGTPRGGGAGRRRGPSAGGGRRGAAGARARAGGEGADEGRGRTRRPGAVPDDPGGVPTGALDRRPSTCAAAPTPTATARPDTLLTTDGADLLVLTDLDGDGLADRVLRIGPDGSVHPTAGRLTTGHPIGTPADVGLDARSRHRQRRRPRPVGRAAGPLLGPDP